MGLSLGTSYDDPRTQGLLSLGLGLLGSRGSFADSLSQAGLGAMGAYRQAQGAQEQRKAREEQQRMQMEQHAMQQRMAQMQLQQAVEQQKQQTTDSTLLRSMMSSGQAGPELPNDPRLMLERGGSMAGVQSLLSMNAAMAPKVEAPLVLSEGARAFVGGREVAANPKAPDLPTNVREYEYGLKNPGFNPWATGMKQAGSTRVNVDAGQRFENAYSTNQGKEFSETMAGINKTAFAAPAQIRKLERMESLLQGVDGGKLAPTGLDIASAANSIGIKMDPKLGNKEAAQALSREIAAGFRQPGTGPMTDKDFENFLLMVPDLSKTAQGRAQITSTMKAAANRDIQIAKMAREYERKNGRLDNGFLDEAAQYIAENPVVGAPQGWKVR